MTAMATRSTSSGLRLSLHSGARTAVRGKKLHDRGRRQRCQGKCVTYSEVLAQSTASDWRALDPAKTLYFELATGRVIIELAPQCRAQSRRLTCLRSCARTTSTTWPSCGCKTTTSCSGATRITSESSAQPRRHCLPNSIAPRAACRSLACLTKTPRRTGRDVRRFSCRARLLEIEPG